MERSANTAKAEFGDVVGAGEFDDAFHVAHPFLDSEKRGQPIEFVGVGGHGDVRRPAKCCGGPVLVYHLDDGGKSETEGELLHEAAADAVDGPNAGAEHANGVCGVAARQEAPARALPQLVGRLDGEGGGDDSGRVAPGGDVDLDALGQRVGLARAGGGHDDADGVGIMLVHGHSSPQMPSNSQLTHLGGSKR